jgi:phage recombination protein Bet
MPEAADQKQGVGVERGLVVYEARDGQEIRLSFDTVRKYLVSGRAEFVTDQEIVLYMGMCKARGLNPFKKDCYLVKYNEKDPAATIVSIDFFRSRARAQPDCHGWKTGILLHNEKTGLEFREGSLMLAGENLVGGWFKGRPGNWENDYTWTVSLAPYVKKTSEGKITQFWREDNQGYMIQKVAESQGLRRLWPDEFQGLQLEDEFKALREVSEESPPLKTPQALPERHDEPAPASGPTQSRSRRRAEPPPPAPPPAAEEKKPESAEKTQDDIINECLLWIETCPVDQLMAEDNWLMAQVQSGKIQGIDNQLKVLRPFNTRRQELQKKT